MHCLFGTAHNTDCDSRGGWRDLWRERFEQSGVCLKSKRFQTIKGTTITNGKKFCSSSSPLEDHLCAIVYACNSLAFSALSTLYMFFKLWDIIIFWCCCLLYLSPTAVRPPMILCTSISKHNRMVISTVENEHGSDFRLQTSSLYPSHIFQTFISTCFSSFDM